MTIIIREKKHIEKGSSHDADGKFPDQINKTGSYSHGQLRIRDTMVKRIRKREFPRQSDTR